MAKLGEIVLEPLIEILRGGNVFTRSGAVKAFGITEDARAFEPLIQAIKDDKFPGIVSVGVSPPAFTSTGISPFA